MQKPSDRTRIFLFFIAVIVICISSAGIIHQEIYSSRLNSISAPELLGQDLVTLIIGILSLVCLVMEPGKDFLKIINTGFLAYFIYIYAYFSFSIISSLFYILYLFVFGASLFLFIFRLSGYTAGRTLAGEAKNYPRRSLSVFFIFIVLLMYVIEFPYLIKCTIIQNKSIRLFDAYYILDTAVVFPAIALTAVFNLLKKPSAVILSGIILVKIITIMPAIIFNDLFYWLENGKFIDLSFDLIAVMFTISTAFFLYFYRRGIRI